MAKIEGTIPLSGTISPFDTLDEFPVTEDIYNKGGHRSVKTLVDRDSISIYRKKEGMIVFVVSNNVPLEYVLSGADTIWNINHNLGKYPSVTVLDSALNQVEGDITYIDYDNIKIEFSATFSGTATLN